MGLAQYKVQRVCVYLSIIANSTNQYNVWFSPCKVMSLPQLHLSWRSTKYWQILQTCQSECKLVEVIHTLFRSDEGGKGFCWNSGSMCAAWWHPLCLGFPPIHHLGAAKICQKFEPIVIFLGQLLYLRCFAWQKTPVNHSFESLWLIFQNRRSCFQETSSYLNCFPIYHHRSAQNHMGQAGVSHHLFNL